MQRSTKQFDEIRQSLRAPHRAGAVDRNRAVATCRWGRGLASQVLLVLAGAAIAGCAEYDREPSEPQSSVQRLTVSHQQADRRIAGETVARLGWGNGPAQVARVDEASRPGPMSLTVGDDGRVYILDQVNRRVLALSNDGAVEREIAIPSDTIEDLVLAGDAVWLLGYRAGLHPDGKGPYELIEVTDDGVVRQRAPLGEQVSLATGLFRTGTEAAPELWVELRHDRQVKVAARGRILDGAAGRPQRSGRPDPSTPGRRLAAARTGSHDLTVAALGADGELRPLLDLTTEVPLVQILELASDRRGTLFVGLHVGVEVGAELLWQGDRRYVLIQPAGDAPSWEVDLGPAGLTDAFREIAVAGDGTLYQLRTDAAGAELLRFRLPDELLDAADKVSR